jgi:hypothetical protein
MVIRTPRSITTAMTKTLPPRANEFCDLLHTRRHNETDRLVLHAILVEIAADECFKAKAFKHIGDIEAHRSLGSWSVAALNLAAMA